MNKQNQQLPTPQQVDQRSLALWLIELHQISRRQLALQANTNPQNTSSWLASPDNQHKLGAKAQQALLNTLGVGQGRLLRDRIHRWQADPDLAMVLQVLQVIEGQERIQNLQIYRYNGLATLDAVLKVPGLYYEPDLWIRLAAHPHAISLIDPAGLGVGKLYRVDADRWLEGQRADLNNMINFFDPCQDDAPLSKFVREHEQRLIEERKERPVFRAWRDLLQQAMDAGIDPQRMLDRAEGWIEGMAENR